MGGRYAKDTDATALTPLHVTTQRQPNYFSAIRYNCAATCSARTLPPPPRDAVRTRDGLVICQPSSVCVPQHQLLTALLTGFSFVPLHAMADDARQGREGGRWGSRMVSCDCNVHVAHVAAAATSLC